MALVGNDWSPADVAALTNGNDNGFGGNGAWWIILLFIILGGWGNNGYGNGGGNGTENALQRGFDQSEIIGGINGVSANIAIMQQAICNGFAQAEIAANARQMADMNQMFALQQQLSQCCCENRLASANLQSTIIAENCADREALNNGVRDIMTNIGNGIQTILDKMCQQELDAERRENANLRSQLNMMNLAASQNAQTAQISADIATQTAVLEQRLNPTPIPAYMVQNPNCCTSANIGCGCSY